MISSELHDEIESAYKILADHLLIGLAFFFSLILPISSIFILNNYNKSCSYYREDYREPLYSAVASLLSLFLPIGAFCLLNKKVKKTILAGTLSYKQTIIIGTMVGIVASIINARAELQNIPELLKALMNSSLDCSTLWKVSQFLSTFSFICLLVPFSEELLFQGWMQTKLQQKMRPINAALCTSAIFLFCHRTVNPLTFIGLLMYAIVRMKTGSLLCCSIAHSVRNLIGLVSIIN